MEHPGTSSTLERGLERAEWDIMEDDGDFGEVGPEAMPPAGKDARAHGGAGTAEALQDLEEQIIREGANEVW